MYKRGKSKQNESCCHTSKKCWKKDTIGKRTESEQNRNIPHPSHPAYCAESQSVPFEMRKLHSKGSLCGHPMGIQQTFVYHMHVPYVKHLCTVRKLVPKICSSRFGTKALMIRGSCAAHSGNQRHYNIKINKSASLHYVNKIPIIK